MNLIGYFYDRLVRKIVKVKSVSEHPDYDRRVEDGKGSWGVTRGLTVYMPDYLVKRTPAYVVLFEHELHHVKQNIVRRVLFFRRFSKRSREVAAFAVSVQKVHEFWATDKADQARFYAKIMASDQYPDIDDTEDRLTRDILRLVGTGRLFA